ncbi:MAG: hypothetical protein ACOY4W_03700 [Thermodesulfobacteriota bacterium]
MIELPVCPLSACPFTRKMDPVPGAAGWLADLVCGRTEDDPPCPARKRRVMRLSEPYGTIDGLPVVSYAGRAILQPAASCLRFLGRPPIKPDELWIVYNWALHFSQRNVSWAVTVSGRYYSLFRLL